MHFKGTSFQPLVDYFPKLLGSEGVLRSFSYIYPEN